MKILILILILMILAVATTTNTNPYKAHCDTLRAVGAVQPVAGWSQDQITNWAIARTIADAPVCQ